MELISVEGGPQLSPLDGFIPGDIRRGLFYGRCWLLPGSKLKISQVGLNPTRSGLLSVLPSLGTDCGSSTRFGYNTGNFSMSQLEM